MKKSNNADQANQVTGQGKEPNPSPKNLAQIKKLKSDIEYCDMSIELSPNANNYYLKAEALFKLWQVSPNELYKNKSLASEALLAYGLAIDASNIPGTSEHPDPLYLVSRSELYLKLGNTNKALADIKATALNFNPSIENANTSENVTIRAKIKNNLQALEAILKTQKDNNTQDPELTKLFDEYVKTTVDFVNKAKFKDYDGDYYASITSILQIVQSDIEQLKKQSANHDSILQDSGTKDKAEIKNAFARIEQEDKELSDYLKTFYWVSINYFEAYRALSTGIIQGSIEESKKDKLILAGVSKAAECATELAKGLPLIGGLVGMVDKVIDSIYGKIKQNRFENKVKAINKVIESKFGIEEDISINVAKLALKSLELRKEEIKHQSLQKLQDGEVSTKQTSAITWLKNKMVEIKSKFFDTLQIHESKAAEIALEDVAMFLAYLYKNHEAITYKNTPSLDKQIESILTNGTFEPMLCEAMASEKEQLQTEQTQTSEKILAKVQAPASQQTIAPVHVQPSATTQLPMPASALAPEPTTEPVLASTDQAPNLQNAQEVPLLVMKHDTHKVETTGNCGCHCEVM